MTLLCLAVALYSHLLLKDFPRHKWICILASCRHFLHLFAIFSQVVLGLCQIVWQQVLLSVQYVKNYFPLFAFLTCHLIISFDILRCYVFTKITASFLFTRATLCFMELCHRFLQPFSAFPAPQLYPLGCTEVHHAHWSKMWWV